MPQGPNMNQLLKQAQQMQAEMAKAQEQLKNEIVEASAGGGMVKVTMTGRHEARRVQIDPSLMNDDRDMLEDLVAAAINDAAHKIEAMTQERMSGMAAGLNLPAGFKLPF